MFSIRSLLPLAVAFKGTTALAAYTNTSTSNGSAQNATSFSLVYGYPLLSWARFVGPFYEFLGVNKWYHSPFLVGANDPTAKNIVAPNEDTLYSVLLVDLARESVKITVPDVSSDWFYLFSFYDPFGDNWANIGTKNSLQGPGNFLLQRSPDAGSCGAQTNTSEGYTAVLNAPQSLGVILVRWLIFNDSSYEQVHQWQNQTSASVVPLPAEEQINGGAGAALAAYRNGSSPADSVMKMLAEINSYCPAVDPGQVTAELTAAGVQNRTYQTPPGVDLQAANATVPIISDQAIAAPGNLINVGNDWNVIAPNASGTYGTHYAVRNAVAGPYYLQITEPNAYYPTYDDNGAASIASHLTLGPDDAYVYTFSGRPPLSDTGFWSLTLYQNQYLVPNPLDRSALGDRANLTFPDGQLIYKDGGDVTAVPDGPFQILVQPADISPPENWTSNWLPGPAGGGSDVSVLLRFYDAFDGVINGSYVYPVVTKQHAISNGSVAAGNSTHSPTFSTSEVSDSTISTYYQSWTQSQATSLGSVQGSTEALTLPTGGASHTSTYGYAQTTAPSAGGASLGASCSKL